MPTGYTGLGAFGDFVGGFTDRSDQMRKESQDEQAKIDARAEKVFTLLANSDDPDIRASAVTGLLSGDHPAKGMDKWFGKVRTHPMYDTISGLVNEGHKPFMNPADRPGAEAASGLRQRMGVVRSPDSGLDKPSQDRAVLGMVGAPPPRPQPYQYGTLTIKKADGTTEEVGGSFDPGAGLYYDDDGNYRSDVSGFRRTTGSQGASGHGTKVMVDKNSPTGYSYVRFDDTMKEIGRTAGAPAPGSATESQTPVQTPTGILAFGNKSGTLKPAKGGEGVTAPAPPGTNVNALRENEASILRLHPQPKPLFAGGTVSPDKMNAWRAAVDAEAVKYGYTNFEDLQGKIGAATQDVGGRVAQPPPDPAATAAPGAPPPAAAPAQKPGQPRRPAAKAAPGGGKIDVKAVLAELEKNRKAAASTIPQPAAR